VSDSEPTNELRNCSLVRRLFVRWFIVRWFVRSLVVVVVRSLALVFGFWFLVLGFGFGFRCGFGFGYWVRAFNACALHCELSLPRTTRRRASPQLCLSGTTIACGCWALSHKRTQKSQRSCSGMRFSPALRVFVVRGSIACLKRAYFPLTFRPVVDSSTHIHAAGGKARE